MKRTTKRENTNVSHSLNRDDVALSADKRSSLADIDNPPGSTGPIKYREIATTKPGGEDDTVLPYGFSTVRPPPARRIRSVFPKTVMATGIAVC